MQLGIILQVCQAQGVRPKIASDMITVTMRKCTPASGLYQVTMVDLHSCLPRIIQKFVLDWVSYREDARNHRNFWHHYTIFFRHVVDKRWPYACAFHNPDGTISGLPWDQCFHNNLPDDLRPIVVIDLDNLKVGTFLDIIDDEIHGTYNLAAWELLHIEEIENFNSVDWAPAKCLMQDGNFQDAMRAFRAATEQYIKAH